MRKIPRDGGPVLLLAALTALLLTDRRATIAAGDEVTASGVSILAQQDLFQPLTEPPCSYCSTQHRKGLIDNDDVVLAWVRGVHNGGAFPLRHFLAAPRVVNDTYGLFFYDPDGGYVAAYQKDYGYRFYGWRRGVMVVAGSDGTLWSALSGRAFAGPQAGKRLQRVPNVLTRWGYWLMLHPESTTYDLFDGKKYEPVSLPVALSSEAKQTMADPRDERLPVMSLVLGVEHPQAKAFPIDPAVERACWLDQLGEAPIAVFWYGPTQSAIAFRREVEGRVLSFYADDGSPESAPFKDRETGSRWTIAGRAVDGPLRGSELDWIDSIQCRWYAWSAEYPETLVHGSQP